MPYETYTSSAIATELEARIGLKGTDTARMIRHYTNQGLLGTVGAVNTGTGRKRVYREDAILKAGILLRLNRMGVPVGVLKEMFVALRKYLAESHGGKDLLKVCQDMEEPCLFLVIPDGKAQPNFRVRLFGRKVFGGFAIDVDAIVIQLARYLPR